MYGQRRVAAKLFFDRLFAGWESLRENFTGQLSPAGTAEKMLISRAGTKASTFTEKRDFPQRPALPGNGVQQPPNSRLVLHEENWLPLIRPLDAFTAVTNAVGG